MRSGDPIVNLVCGGAHFSIGACSLLPRCTFSCLPFFLSKKGQPPVQMICWQMYGFDASFGGMCVMVFWWSSLNYVTWKDNRITPFSWLSLFLHCLPQTTQLLSQILNVFHFRRFLAMDSIDLSLSSSHYFYVQHPFISFSLVSFILVCQVRSLFCTFVL